MSIIKKAAIVTLSLFVMIPASAPAALSNWCPFGYAEKHQVMELTAGFFSQYNAGKFYAIRRMLAPEEMSYAGEFWMSTPRFLYFLGVIHERGPVVRGAIRAYSFDDCERDPGKKKFAMEMYRIFDSESLLTVSDISYTEKGRKNATYAGLLFKKNPETGDWYICAISGFDARPKEGAAERPGQEDDWTSAEIPRIGLAFPLHRDFARKTMNEEIIEFALDEKSPSQAAFQVMAVKNRRPLAENAREFLKKILKGRRYADFRIRYLPQGYWLECRLLDRKGGENRIIVAALEKKRYRIFVSFTGGMDYYATRWREIEYSLRNIELY
jgi:hypothetical protein